MKLKAFAHQKLIVAKMTISLLDRIENTVEKDGNAGYQLLSPFPKVFTKAFFWVVKSQDCVVKS